MKNRILSMALCLCLLLTLLPTAALATDYSSWENAAQSLETLVPDTDTVVVGGVSYLYKGDVSSTSLYLAADDVNVIYKAGPGYVLWDGSHTATLNGAVIAAGSKGDAALKLPASATVMLQGENTLSHNSRVITCMDGTLTIQGGGKLCTRDGAGVTARFVTISNNAVLDISYHNGTSGLSSSAGDITITDSTVTVKSDGQSTDVGSGAILASDNQGYNGGNSNVFITNSKVIAIDSTSFAINAAFGEVKLNNSYVVAIGKSNDFGAIYTDYSSQQYLTVSGGTLFVQNTGTYYDITYTREDTASDNARIYTGGKHILFALGAQNAQFANCAYEESVDTIIPGNGQLSGSWTYDDNLPSAGQESQLTLASGGTLVNSGTLVLSGTLTNAGTLVNNGKLVLPTGTTPEQIAGMHLSGIGVIIVSGVTPETNTAYTNDGTALNLISGDLSLNKDSVGTSDYTWAADASGNYTLTIKNPLYIDGGLSFTDGYMIDKIHVVLEAPLAVGKDLTFFPENPGGYNHDIDLTISGNSQMSVAGYLNGTGDNDDTFTVSGGAQVTVAGNFFIGASGAADSYLYVTGAGSRLTIDNFSGEVLSVTNGGALTVVSGGLNIIPDGKLTMDDASVITATNLSGGAITATLAYGQTTTDALDAITDYLPHGCTLGTDDEIYGVLTADGKLAPTVTLKKQKTTVTISGLTAENATYDGNAHSGCTGTVNAGVVDTSTLVYAYTGTDASGAAYRGATPPTNAGSYQLTVSVPEDNATYTGTSTLNFTIGKKDLHVTGVTAANRIYNGTTSVAVSGGALDSSDLIAGDSEKLTLIGTAVSGTIASGDASDTPKAVAVTGYALSGAASANYQLVQPAYVTVTISKAPTQHTQVTFDYVTEIATTTDHMQYQNANGSWTDCTANISLTGLGWNGAALTVNLRTKAADANHADSAAQALAIPARPAAPAADLFTVGIPSKNGSDGTLSGITADMEYKTTGNYTTASGATISSIPDGTVYAIRYKAVAGSKFASKTHLITVASKTDVGSKITFANGSAVYNGQPQLHQTATMDAGVTGGSFTYTYTPAAGSSLTNGKPQNAGVYTVTAIYESGSVLGSASATFIIQKATVTVTAPSKTAYVGEPLPSLGTAHTVTGLVGNDQLGGTVTMQYQKNGAAVTPNMTIVGAYDIAIFGATAPNTTNYNPVAFVFGTLTISGRPIDGMPLHYILHFETNGGSQLDSVSIATGTTAVLSDYQTTRDGYRFAGWYSDSDLTTSVTAVKMTRDTTVYAKWTKSDLPFTDVPGDAYYRDAVEWAVTNGVTSGMTATTFAPDALCTRAQAVTFLWRAEGSPEPAAAANPFTDVSTGAYYYKAVLWAVEKGITTGTSATTFSPDLVCTRAQVVTFLWRGAGKPVVNYAMSFTDVAADSYYAEAVRWAVSEGITAGTSATRFSPAGSCTRAQIVTFLYRYLSK